MPRSPIAAALVVALCVTGASRAVPPANAQVLRTAFWQPDGPVNATAYAGGLLYVGGEFTHVAPVTGGMATLDAGTGHVTAPLHVVGKVNAMVGDGAGGWYVGGAFTSVQGLARSNLAHFDASGNVTPWNPGASAEVYALAFDTFHPSQVYVSGRFTTLGGQPRNYLGAVDPVTGAARAWQPALTADVGSPAVYAMATRAGLVYLGGAFSKVNGLYRFNTALVDSFGTDQAFDPDVNGAVRTLAVRALITSPFTVTVYLGGDFTFINGQAANHLGSVDGNSGVSNSFAASVDGTVNALALSVTQFGSVTVWAGGAFTHANGSARSYLASFNGTGALNAWNPGTNDVVDALGYANGTVYAGGVFRGAAGQARSHLAAITTAGAATAWDPAPDSTVHALGFSGSTVAVGGEFNSAGGIPRHGLVALNATTGQPTTWDPHPDAAGIITGLLADGGNLFVGGYFDSIGGQKRASVAQFALSTGLPTAWNPGASGPVRHFLVHKGSVFVAGGFNILGPLARPGLGAVDLAGNVTAWNPGSVSGTVAALAANSNTIFVGGNFAGISNNATRNIVAGLNDSTALVTGWNPSTNGGTVEALAVSGGSVWIGGRFSVMGGASTNALAQVDTSVGIAHNNGLSAPDPSSEVRSLLLDGSTLYVGGRFGGLGGQPPANLAAINTAIPALVPWNPNLDATVDAVAAGAGSVFAGGLIQGTVSPLTRLPQTRLAAVTTAVTGVGPPEPLPVSGGLRLSPNPARADVTIQFALPAAGGLSVQVFDLAGRRVRTLVAGPSPAGPQSVAWDGRDEAGRRVPPGVYLVRVRAGAVRLSARAVRLD